MPNQIAINEYYIEIKAESSDPAFLQLINEIEIFAMRSKNTYRCSLKYIQTVFKILRNIESAEQLVGKTHDLYLQEYRRQQFTPLLKKYGTNLTHEFLWLHQLLGVELAELNDRYAFFFDTRTGKTLLSYEIMLRALQAGKAKRCIVVCPSAIIQDWLNDARDFFPMLKVVAYYGTAAQKHSALATPSHIIIWSMEQFVSNIDMLNKLSFDICFVDESSKLKSHRAQISQAMLEYSLRVPRWYLLSATPAPNNESEYYTQMRTVDPYIFNPARGKFVAKYFDDKSRSRNYEKLVIKPDMYEAFMETVEERAIYVEQNVMPTAGKEWKLWEYELPPETKRVYNEMRSNMAATVGDTTITAEMAAAMRAKLNQITSGFIMDTDAIKENKMARKLGERATNIEIYPVVAGGDHSRILELDKLLSGMKDRKVVIWANYKEEFRMLEEYFGAAARYIRGGTSVGDKDQFVNEFKHGNLQYLVCHPQSIGMGKNFTPAYTAIYYSMSDSYEAFKQSSERIAGHIKVQPNKCEYYIMLAVGTVNKLIYSNVINKRDANFAFNEHLKAEALE